MSRYDLPEPAWNLIKPLLPLEKIAGQGGRPYVDHRPVINGIFWVLCTGAPWRDLPDRYGSWKTVYNRFNRWSKEGIITIIFNKLLTLLDEHQLIDWSAIAIDSRNISALKCAAGAKKSTPMTTKIMRLVAPEVVLVPKSTWQPIIPDSH